MIVAGVLALVLAVSLVVLEVFCSKPGRATVSFLTGLAAGIALSIGTAMFMICPGKDGILEMRGKTYRCIEVKPKPVEYVPVEAQAEKGVKGDD
jgi:hypothetical protein